MSIVSELAEPREIGRLARPDIGVVGDLATVADRILYWLDEAEIPPSGFRTPAMAATLAAHRPTNPNAGPASSDTIDIVEGLRWLDGALPRARTLVTDAGRFTIQAWRHMSVPSPDAFVSAVGFGAIGLGMGVGIGTCIGRPECPTILVIGDGGFMLGGMAEFNTAVRHKLDLIVILCNDTGYGAEHIQFRSREMDPALALFDWPDFSNVAVALGGEAITLRSKDNMSEVAEAIRTRSGPLLIELRLNPDYVPPVK